jgi:hypothetical protein
MSGFRHLYLVNVNVNQGIHINDMLSQCEPTFHQLTSGDWEVDGNKVLLFEPMLAQYYVLCFVFDNCLDGTADAFIDLVR